MSKMFCASFPCSNFSTFLPIFFKLCIDIGIGEEWYGIVSGIISFRNNRVMILDLCPKCMTGRGSSIGSEFAWHVSGPEFDPHVRHILSLRLGHENISTAILPLPLIQEEQLSVTGERMCTKYW